MEPTFLDEGCDVFMNENEIKLKEKLTVKGLRNFKFSIKK
jgi:hypothetical protein